MVKNLSSSSMLPIKSSSQGLKDPRAALQGRVWVRLNCVIEALVQPLPVPLENLYLLNPAAFCKTLLSGSLIHSPLSVDISAVRKSWDCPDKAPPGPQCPISSSLSQQLPGGTWCRYHCGQSSSPGVFNSLIWTGKSQPSLLPLITPKFPEGIFACWVPETQAFRLFHNYRYAAEGLSRYSERLLLCVFADKYSSSY